MFIKKINSQYKMTLKESLMVENIVKEALAT